MHLLLFSCGRKQKIAIDPVMPSSNHHANETRAIIIIGIIIIIIIIDATRQICRWQSINSAYRFYGFTIKISHLKTIEASMNLKIIKIEKCTYFPSPFASAELLCCFFSSPFLYSTVKFVECVAIKITIF